MTYDRDKMPWLPGSQSPNRVPPRECVGFARDALSDAYGYEVAALPHLIEAIDWLRRALEQMAEPFDAPKPPSADDLLRPLGAPNLEKKED